VGILESSDPHTGTKDKQMGGFASVFTGPLLLSSIKQSLSSASYFGKRLLIRRLSVRCNRFLSMAAMHVRRLRGHMLKPTSSKLIPHTQLLYQDMYTVYTLDLGYSHKMKFVVGSR
jgi:hypothetical protein